MAILTTPSEVIDALDGTRAVARLFGFEDAVVSNWRPRGFPAESYVVLQIALRAKSKKVGIKFVASPRLWGMYEAAR